MAHTPCILAIETTTGPCSVAIWKDGGIAAYSENTGPSMQSARLLPMITTTMQQAGVEFTHLTAVAATIGPGSFTGIRVGLATARGIAFSTGIDGLGFTTLDVLAYAAKSRAQHDRRQILALLHAGKGEWYYQGLRFTQEWTPLYSPRVGTLTEAVETVKLPALAIGPIDTMPEGFQIMPVLFPRADILAELAALNSASAQPLKPLYIRPPDATLPKT